MTKMILPVADLPSAISESVGLTLFARGLSLSDDVLREIGNNTTQALYAIDEVTFPERVVDKRPTAAELLVVGQTLRALAAAGRPNVATADRLARVGDWLSRLARTEITGLCRTCSTGCTARCSHEHCAPCEGGDCVNANPGEAA